MFSFPQEVESIQKPFSTGMENSNVFLFLLSPSSSSTKTRSPISLNLSYLELAPFVSFNSILYILTLRLWPIRCQSHSSKASLSLSINVNQTISCLSVCLSADCTYLPTYTPTYLHSYLPTYCFSKFMYK